MLIKHIMIGVHDRGTYKAYIKPLNLLDSIKEIQITLCDVRNWDV